MATVTTNEFTLRQQEIVAGAAKQLNIPYNSISSAEVNNGLPETISVKTEKGNYNTSIIPLYGSLLTPTEKTQLIQNRLAAADASLESLNGVSDLLGKAKQPIVSSAGTDRIKIENANQTSYDPSMTRRAAAGLPIGAQNVSGSNAQPVVKFTAPNGPDTRVRIVVPNGDLQSLLLNGPVLYPLRETNGVLFPYTPSITISHGARYNPENLTHSNYAYQFYQYSETESINITATFACKNGADANYVVAVQHFFRTVTKMFYGQDAQAGLPPPVLRLEGHGDYQFGAHAEQVGGVPIVIENFSITLPEDVDYISTDPSANSVNAAAAAASDAANGTVTRVPIVQQFSLTCKPLYSRKSITGDFGFKKFAQGQLLATSSRGGFI